MACTNVGLRYLFVEKVCWCHLELQAVEWFKLLQLK